MNNSLKAVIFDLDGVLTDTAHFHFLAWKQIAGKVGVHFDEAMNEQLKGIDRMGSLDLILQQSDRTFSDEERHQLAAEKNTNYQALIQQISPEDVFSGVVGLIDVLRTSGFRLGVASVSKNAQFVLQQLGITGAFDYIADAAKISRSKPDPEIFLTVAQALKVPPAYCVGIEDAAAGVQAIKSAGMPAIGVGEPDVLYQADKVVAATGDIQLSTIEALLPLLR